MGGRRGSSKRLSGALAAQRALALAEGRAHVPAVQRVEGEAVVIALDGADEHVGEAVAVDVVAAGDGGADAGALDAREQGRAR